MLLHSPYSTDFWKWLAERLVDSDEMLKRLMAEAASPAPQPRQLAQPSEHKGAAGFSISNLLARPIHPNRLAVRAI